MIGAANESCILISSADQDTVVLPMFQDTLMLSSVHGSMLASRIINFSGYGTACIRSSVATSISKLEFEQKVFPPVTGKLNCMS